MLEFTHLERSVLDSIGDAHRGALPGINELLSAAVAESRENTGHGFYTDFRSSADIDHSSWPWPISGPSAQMVGLGDDVPMGFVLWRKDREAFSLEGFQHGDVNGQTVNLKTLNLADLRFSKLEWHPADRL